MATHKVVFFGDSITKAGSNPDGYISLLQQNVLQAWEVINAGQGGNKITDLLERVNADVLAHKPTCVVVNIGINDIWHAYQGYGGTSLDKFIEYYQMLIDVLNDSNRVILLCTPTIMGESMDSPCVADADIDSYTQKIVELAQINHLPVADLRAAFVAARLENNLQNQEFGLLTTDGVHLAAQGQALAAKILQKTLANLLKIA